MGPQQLDGEQPDQAQPRNHHGFAEGRADQPDTLQRDCAQHGEDCRLVIHLGRHLRTKVGWHCHDLGVSSVGCHAVADTEASDVLADGQHRADVAVPHCDRLIQLVADRLDGRQ